MSKVDLSRHDAALYHPEALGYRGPAPLWLIVRASSDPMTWVPRLREIVAEVDANALVERPRSLAVLRDEGRAGLEWTLVAVAVISAIAILLSVAGLYALMSFTVSQRTREIGVRTALGADRRHVMWLIARRAVLQLSGGVALGSVGSFLFVRGAAPELFDRLEGAEVALLFAVACVLLVGGVACVRPTRQGWRVQPMDALRADG